MDENAPILPEIEKKLTAREERFCWGYLNYLNAAKAAREAGYSEENAREIGYQNLTKLHIQNRITAIRKEMAGKYDVTKEALIQELANIARFDLRDVYNEDGSLKKPSEWSEEAGKAIAGVEVDEIKEFTGEIMEIVGYTKKVKRDNKIGAIAELNKMLGHNAPDKVDATVRNYDVTLNLNK